MKIESATLNLQASNNFLIRDQSSERLRAWSGSQRPDFEGRSTTRVSLSTAAQVSLSNDSMPPASPTAGSRESAAIDAAMEEVNNDPMLALIRSMVELFTGQKIRIFSRRDWAQAASPELPSLKEPAQKSSPATGNSSPRPAPAGYGVEYDRHTLHEEIQTSNFSAEGLVRTSDGQEFRFKIDLHLERQFRQESNFSLRAGDAVRKDPIVLNFDGAGAQLTDQHFSFDLNANGHPVLMPMLAEGSGYLAFDRNGNGKIDSGSELFGPASNNGFAELAALDLDHNGWIDEADPGFAQLSIWAPGQNSALTSLNAAGIGALGLDNLTTPFEFRSQDNADLGALRASSVFLRENGRPGLLQEIDLTV